MRALAILILSLGVTAPALAAPGGAPPPEKPATSTTTPSATSQATGPRKEAELSYSLAYQEVEKAKKDLAAGKTKNAEKRFKRALERAEKAVGLDAAYHEAWNLVGYSHRKLGNFEKALAAYEKCLGLQWDYAPAREYLGEAYVERGEIAKAREQLAILERIRAEEEAGELRELIAGYVKAHPEVAAETPEPAPAAADTTR